MQSELHIPMLPRLSLLLFPLYIFASPLAVAWGAETHADGVISRVLDNVAKLKAADPQAVPMAFWDFDGTIIRGDVSI